MKNCTLQIDVLDEVAESVLGEGWRDRSVVLSVHSALSPPVSL